MTLDALQLADLAGKDFAILLALACAIACGLCMMFYAGCRAGLELVNDWRERRVKSAAYISAHVIQLPKPNTAADGHDVSSGASNRDLANT